MMFQRVDKRLILLGYPLDKKSTKMNEESTGLSLIISFSFACTNVKRLLYACQRVRVIHQAINHSPDSILNTSLDAVTLKKLAIFEAYCDSVQLEVLIPSPT